MKNFLFIVLFNIFANIQNNNTVFFGIDFKMSWTKLTTLGYNGYSELEKITPQENQFIVIDCKKSLKNPMQKSFLDLSFNEIMLCFPKNNWHRLDELNPEVFIAIITYQTIETWNNKHNDDVLKIKNLISESFGTPNLNKVEDDYSMFKWETSSFSIVLNSRKEDKKTNLYVMKK